MPASVRITGLTLACTLCGDEAHVEADSRDDAALRGALWMASHQAAEIVAVETEHDGELAEWVAT